MEVKQIRLANLRALIEREGAVSQLALRLQISPIYIYRVLDGKFNVGDSMARKIEDAYERPMGWMDNLHNQSGSSRRAEREIPTLTDTATQSEKPAPEEQIEESDPMEAVIERVLEILDVELNNVGGPVSENDKAKILMRAAERLLDNKSRGQVKKNEQKTFRRIS